MPEHPINAPMHKPISDIYENKEVGEVLASRVGQGVVKTGEEAILPPTHTTSDPCTGEVITVEMHHQSDDFAKPGDNVVLNNKGLDSKGMPRSGDVMVHRKDTTLGKTGSFDAQIQLQDIPSEIKTGHSQMYKRQLHVEQLFLAEAFSAFRHAFRKQRLERICAEHAASERFLLRLARSGKS